MHAGDDIGQVGYQPLLVFLAEGGPQLGECFAAQLRHDQIGPDRTSLRGRRGIRSLRSPMVFLPLNNVKFNEWGLL